MPRPAQAGAGDAAASPNPLVIRRLDFIGGMAEPGGWRPDATLPEVAFAGRSNVGKSDRKSTRLNSSH